MCYTSLNGRKYVLMMKSIRSFFAKPTLVVAMSVLIGCSRSDVSRRAEAVRLLQAGANDAAIRAFSQLVRRDFGNAEDYCNLGIANWRAGHIEPAVSAFKTAAELNSSDSAPLEFLAAIHIEQQKWDTARAMLNEAKKRSPMSPRIPATMALLEYRAGNVDAAQNFLEESLDLNPDYGPALYNMALLYRDEHNDEIKAAEYFRMYLEITDDKHHSLRAQAFLGALPASGIEPELLLSSLPAQSSAEPLIQAAQQAIESAEYDTALIALKRATKIDPTNATALWHLAVIYDKHLADSDTAAATYREFAALFPNDPRVGEIPVSMLQAKEIAIEAESPAGLFQKGVECHSRSDWDGAISFYGLALAQDDRFSDAYFNLGLAHKAKGDLIKARDAFVCALNTNPDMLRAMYMLAVTYRELKDAGNAVRHAQKVVGIDPGHAKAHYLLGLLYRDAMRYDMAQTHFERCIELAPKESFAKKAKEWLAKTR
ncbi:MAG: tetratricopeptide repeat protein [Lentisphaerae bacterium]|nr:tetratricopeptide repeat protein [Lentisphaerota bacterium]